MVFLDLRNLISIQKLQNTFVGYRPSERGESPSYSSLNHSYETLNMSDAGDSAYAVAQSLDKNTKENVPRIPHRPAPPVPVPKYKMTAGMFEIITIRWFRIFFNI